MQVDELEGLTHCNCKFAMDFFFFQSKTILCFGEFFNLDNSAQRCISVLLMYNV